MKDRKIMIETKDKPRLLFHFPLKALSRISRRKFCDRVLTIFGEPTIRSTD